MNREPLLCCIRPCPSRKIKFRRKDNQVFLLAQEGENQNFLNRDYFVTKNLYTGCGSVVLFRVPEILTLPFACGIGIDST